MTLVLAGALLGGLISGLIMKSIFGGIAFAILLILFFVIWRYMQGEQKGQARTAEGKEEPNNPPVSVGNVASNQPTDSANVPQNPQQGI